MNQENPAPPSAPPPNDAPQTSGLAIGALICGILALLLVPTIIGAPLLATIAIVLAVVHLLSKRRTGGRVLSIVGLVCSLIAIVGASMIGIWAFNKGKQVVDDVTGITSSLPEAAANASAIVESIEGLPVGNEEAATIAKNLNTEIDAPSLEGLDIGSLLGALSNPDDPAAMSNLNAYVEAISNDDVQKQLNDLGLEGLGSTIENLGSQFQELNELLAE